MDNNTNNTQEIICPYCGYEFVNSWEHNQSLRIGEKEVDCQSCDESFVVDINVEVTYNSYKKKEV